MFWTLALLTQRLARADAADDAAAESKKSTFADYERATRANQTTLLPLRLDAHGVLTWKGDVGAGLRLDIPIFRRVAGEVSRDEVALSLGADVSFINVDGSEQLTAWPTITGQWTLGVNKRFALYPELGLVARLRGADFKGIYPNIGLGGRLQLYKMLGLVARLGWPTAVSIGLTLQ